MMADNTVRLYADGDYITLDDLARVADYFSKIINGLTRDSSATDVDWTVKNLSSGSVDIVSEGQTETDHGRIAIKVVRELWAELPENIERGRMSMYSPFVLHNVNELRQLVDGRVTSLRCSLGKDDDGDPMPRLEPKPPQPKRETIGAIRGRVVGMASKQHLSVSVYVAAWDRAVPCYLRPESIGEMGKYWDMDVSVRGTITRDKDGIPMSVKGDVRLSILEPGEYIALDVGGRLPWLKGRIEIAEDWWDA